MCSDILTKLIIYEHARASVRTSVSARASKSADASESADACDIVNATKSAKSRGDPQLWTKIRLSPTRTGILRKQG